MRGALPWRLACRVLRMKNHYYINGISDCVIGKYQTKDRVLIEASINYEKSK